MLRQTFVLSRYDWSVDVYYHISCYYIDDILGELRDMECSNTFLEDAYRNIAKNKLNTGLTFSNNKLRKSLIVISDTSSPEQFINSCSHEIYHLVDHIAEHYNIDRSGEEIAYLTGYIWQLMYPKAKKFLCSCCKD